MAEDPKQPGKESFGGITDEAIRRFLLGRLASSERAMFEEGLFNDESLEERVRLAEFELADDYAFERLSAADRELLERAFAVSAARRQQINVSAALRSSSLLATVPEATSPKTSVSETLFRFFGINQPLLGYAIGFAALLIFAGIVWVVVRESRPNQPAIATSEPTPLASPAISRPTESQTPNPTVSPAPPTKASPAPDVSSPRLVIATFVLLPGALRDGGEMTRVALPPGERGIVRLQLKLETDEPGSYAAELLTAEGQSLYVSHKLKTTRRDSSSQVAFDVPGDLLKRNDYQVKLTRTSGGSTTSAGRYPFRVTE